MFWMLFFSGDSALWPGLGRTKRWLDRSSQIASNSVRPPGHSVRGRSSSANVPGRMGSSTARGWSCMARRAKTRATIAAITKTLMPSLMAPLLSGFTLLSEVSHTNPAQVHNLCLCVPVLRYTQGCNESWHEVLQYQNVQIFLLKVKSNGI